MLDLQSYAAGRWIETGPEAREIACAITGAPFARAGNAIDAADVASHARNVGGPALRALTFHDRARMLKALALYLGERKEALYALSHHTGATSKDNLIDIDGGIGTIFVYASKGRREMPDARIYVEGEVEALSRDGSFWGQHVCVPKTGFALLINAFNFPVWGMLEKLAPAILAGVPCVVKPATASAYVTEAAVRMIAESGILPEGALQLVLGDVSGLIDELGAQDTLAFTGSAATATLLRGHSAFLTRGAAFMAEQDSLNASILGPDAAPGSIEWDLFLKEARREMTTKAGQKCTAIRRLIVPDAHVETLTTELAQALGKVRMGDPRRDDVQMGALVSEAQRRDVLTKAAQIGTEADLIFGSLEGADVLGEAAQGGAFVSPLLYRCDDPDAAKRVHDTEAFGPVSTIMGYRDLGHAARLANRGEGSLVASVFSGAPEVVEALVLEMAPWHGRLYVNNARAAAGATGHGAPMPHMVHGGPGRAGGGEELGGVRGAMHYMQRTAVQGDPTTLSVLTKRWMPGAQTTTQVKHPFRRSFDQLQIGETIETEERCVTLEDIEHFAEFTGDTFYAHMDDAAAKANPFFPGRVAHGYLLLSFAAGLFVDPDPGPVLANTGLDNLRFMKPVAAGDSISVELTVKGKTPRNPEYGEVRWHVRLHNQDKDIVAEYELLTMNAVVA